MHERSPAVSPTVALPYLDEEICYLKWDLGRFLRERESELLPESLTRQIRQLLFWADRRKPENQPTQTAEFEDISVLEATALQIVQVLNDFTQLQGMGKHIATPRERLTETELQQTVIRISQVIFLMKGHATLQTVPEPANREESRVAT